MTGPKCQRFLSSIRATNAYGISLMLVDPGVNVSCGLSQIGQIAVFEGGGVAPLVSRFVNAMECRVVEVAGMTIVGPHRGNDVTVAQAVDRFVCGV